MLPFIKEAIVLEKTLTHSLLAGGNKSFSTLLSLGCAFWLCTHQDVNSLHLVTL
jgi:hypothetical protein